MGEAARDEIGHVWAGLPIRGQNAPGIPDDDAEGQ